MNWYNALLVGDDDIRLTKNHIKLDSIRYSDVVFKIQRECADLKMAQTIWTTYDGDIPNTTRYIHLVVTKINADTIELKKVKDDMPNVIVITPYSILFVFDRNHIGPSSITMGKDGDVSCQFDVFVKGSSRFVNGSVITTISVSDIMENDIVDPFDTEFFKDPLAKMEYLSILRNNDMVASFARGKIQDLLRGK